MADDLDIEAMLEAPFRKVRLNWSLLVLIAQIEPHLNWSLLVLIAQIEPHLNWSLLVLIAHIEPHLNVVPSGLYWSS